MNMMSLYDYLGRAAGPELGKQVAAAASMKNVPMNTRFVEQGGYSGPIILYPKSFLDEFFGGSQGMNSGKQLLKG